MTNQQAPPAIAVAARLSAGARDYASEAFLYLLGTHFLVDCFASTLPTVQPVLVDRFGLTLTQAGLLGGLWMLSSSVLQLPLGLLSDRFSSRYFTVLSPIIAAVFLTSLGLATSIFGVVALLVLGGSAVAAYHPHSTSQAGRIGAGRRGISTSVFITVGTAGLGLGPLYIDQVIESVGFDRLWMAAIPVLAAAPVLLWRVPQPVADSRTGRQGLDLSALRRERKALSAHYALVVLRSITQVGLAQYISLYMVRVRGVSLWAASVALSANLLSTSVGALLGGAAADRFGGRRVILASCMTAEPFLAVFLLTEGWISTAALFAGGVLLLSTVPVNVAMAQELVPTQAGVASALMMGFGWGVAGIVFVPVAGWLADSLGLELVLWGFTLLPACGIPIALALPEKGRVDPDPEEWAG